MALRPLPGVRRAQHRANLEYFVYLRVTGKQRPGKTHLIYFSSDLSIGNRVKKLDIPLETPFNLFNEKIRDNWSFFSLDDLNLVTQMNTRQEYIMIVVFNFGQKLTLTVIKEGQSCN